MCSIRISPKSPGNTEASENPSFRIADRLQGSQVLPPHRSVRARLGIRLLPRMNGGNADIRINVLPCPAPCKLGDMPIPALCRAPVRLNDVLLGLRPSLPSLRRWLPSFVRPRCYCVPYQGIQFLIFVVLGRAAWLRSSPRFLKAFRALISRSTPTTPKKKHPVRTWMHYTQLRVRNRELSSRQHSRMTDDDC